MKNKKIEAIRWVWDLALTPFYFICIAAASLFVLASGGVFEFKEFWKRNI
jgi:hypothetical protein